MAADTRERFRRWYESQETQDAAARLLHCNRSYLPQLASGPKLPERRIALETATADWAEGQIAASEWDEVFVRERPDDARRLGLIASDAEDPSAAA